MTFQTPLEIGQLVPMYGNKAFMNGTIIGFKWSHNYGMWLAYVAYRDDVSARREWFSITMVEAWAAKADRMNMNAA